MKWLAMAVATAEAPAKAAVWQYIGKSLLQSKPSHIAFALPIEHIDQVKCKQRTNNKNRFCYLVHCFSCFETISGIRQSDCFLFGVVRLCVFAGDSFCAFSSFFFYLDYMEKFVHRFCSSIR